MKINDLIRRRNEASSRGHANKGGITKTVISCKVNIKKRKIGYCKKKNLIYQSYTVSKYKGKREGKNGAQYMFDLQSVSFK